MNNEKNKRLKTKYRIMQAMESLLNEYSYDQITVSMITKTIPIARQSFYKFYKDKEDLSRSMYLYFTDRAAIMDHDFSLKEFILHDLTEINKHIVFFNKLAEQPLDNELLQILHDNIYNIYMRMLRYRLKARVSREMSFLLDGYCIGGVYKLISLLKEEKLPDLEYLTDLFIDMIPQRIKQIMLSGEYPSSIIKE